MEDLEECANLLIESFRDVLIDPSMETINSLEEACREMEIAMDTARAVSENILHIHTESDGQ